mmetsp:Transcript_32334/g.77572  ORF Transcript_32334/g.77572 Transcript_32334/m.77572 type:complete len:373 (-) Transcript_32334:7-1125(-)
MLHESCGLPQSASTNVSRRHSDSQVVPAIPACRGHSQNDGGRTGGSLCSRVTAVILGGFDLAFRVWNGIVLCVGSHRPLRQFLVVDVHTNHHAVLRRAILHHEVPHCFPKKMLAAGSVGLQLQAQRVVGKGSGMQHSLDDLGLAPSALQGVLHLMLYFPPQKPWEQNVANQNRHHKREMLRQSSHLVCQVLAPSSAISIDAKVLQRFDGAEVRQMCSRMVRHLGNHVRDTQVGSVGEPGSSTGEKTDVGISASQICSGNSQPILQLRELVLGGAGRHLHWWSQHNSLVQGDVLVRICFQFSANVIELEVRDLFHDLSDVFMLDLHRSIGRSLHSQGAGTPALSAAPRRGPDCTRQHGGNALKVRRLTSLAQT